MKRFAENYRIIVDGWCCDGATRMDEAFRKATEWVKMGHTDILIIEKLTKMVMKHDPSRTNRF